jgi:hypothetical protein
MNHSECKNPEFLKHIIDDETHDEYVKEVEVLLPWINDKLQNLTPTTARKENITKSDKFKRLEFLLGKIQDYENDHLMVNLEDVPCNKKSRKLFFDQAKKRYEQFNCRWFVINHKGQQTIIKISSFKVIEAIMIWLFKDNKNVESMTEELKAIFDSQK